MRLAKDCCFDWQKGDYKDLRCALLGKSSFHTLWVSSKEENNTNSSCLSQELCKNLQ